MSEFVALVPKQIPWMGGTLNMGQRAGVLWLVIFILLLAVVPLAVTLAIKGF
jgi:hypothetical protein